MKYNFNIPKEEEVFYICEVNKAINDLSLIKSEEIIYDECSDRENCIIRFNGIFDLLLSKNFYSKDENLMRELYEIEDKYYNGSCISNKDNKVYIYELKSEYDLSGGDEAIFSLSENDNNEKLPIEMKCSLLAKSDGESISIEESEIIHTLYYKDGIYQTSGCNPDDDKSGICNKDGDETEMTISEAVAKCIEKILKKQNKLIIPISTCNTTIWNKYLKAGKWISIGDEYFQIIDIDTKIIDYSCDDGNRRLLSESRILTPNSIKGVSATIDPIPPSISGTVPITININPDLQSSTTSRYESNVVIECSNNGKCNRESGLCECFVGFSGSACQRVDCPSNCNGNGRCVSLSELLSNEELKEYGGYGNKGLEVKVYGCLCDKRHRGYDCSLIECPSGEDPEGVSNMKEGEEYRDCSGRGICNYENGICECFDGFSGEGCQNQVSTI